MFFWIQVISQIVGLLSALVLFYSATDAHGKITWSNNQNSKFDTDSKRRKIASLGGLLLVTISIFLQLIATVGLR